MESGRWKENNFRKENVLKYLIVQIRTDLWIKRELFVDSGRLSIIWLLCIYGRMRHFDPPYYRRVGSLRSLMLETFYVDEKGTGFADNLRRKTRPTEQRLVWKRSFITGVSFCAIQRPTFHFTRKILIFIPELFLRACLICRARHKPKKARNQSRSPSQEHEPNHFLFVRPPLSFHRGHWINMYSFTYLALDRLVG